MVDCVHLVNNTERRRFVAGHLNYAKLNRMAETNRLRGHGIWDYMEGFNSNMFGRHWQFTPILYDRAAIDFPMTMKTWLGGFGRTSVDLSQTIEESATGDLLASGVFRIVNVDPKTQSSIPLPDKLCKWLSKMETTETGNRFPVIKPPAMIPDQSFSCQVVVRRDDMDFLFHTTQSAYLGFARECAAQASEAGFYSHYSDDIAFSRASETTGIHFAESFAGDELKVSTWEDSCCPLLLHFTVSKDNRIIYYATVQYFDDS